MITLKMNLVSDIQLQSANRFCQKHLEDFVAMLNATKLTLSHENMYFFFEAFIGKDKEVALEECYDAANLIHLPTENGTLYFDLSYLKLKDLIAE